MIAVACLILFRIGDNPIQSHKFETYDLALAYLEERGTLTFFGWEGQLEGYYVYTFVAKTGIKYHCDVYKSGLVKVREF